MALAGVTDVCALNREVLLDYGGRSTPAKPD